MTTIDVGLDALVAAADPHELAAIAQHLGERELVALERVVADLTHAGWRSSPLDLALELNLDINGTPVMDLAHTRFLSEQFVDAVTGVSPRQIWNVPGQHGKSAIASQLGPLWALDRDPTTGIILTSYGDLLAKRNAIWVRDQMEAHADVLSTTLRRDVRSARRMLTSEGGQLLAAGRGASMTGFGARGIVVDDPFKNWEEAHSETVREAVWSWYRSVVRTRLHDRPGRPGWIIVVMTRWHEDDLTGKLLGADEGEDAYDDWEVVRLPAIAEAPDPTSPMWWMRLEDALGRRPGEALAPMLFDLRALEARARDLGSFLAAGLEAQRPAPEAGTDILREWWRWFDTRPPKFDDAVASWDMKLKDKETGDFVVGQAWGRTGADFYLVDQLRGQFDFPTTKVAIALLKVRNPWIKRTVIENTGNGPEVMQELRQGQKGFVLDARIIGLLGITEDEVPKVEHLIRAGMPALVPENVKGSKRVRARAQTGKIENHNVHVPHYRGIGDSLVDEAALFPNGKHDDQVDAMSQALKRLSSGSSRVRRPNTTGAPKQRATTARAATQPAGTGRRRASGIVRVARANAPARRR